MKKRSITIAGHRTSISLEEPFWNALQDISRREGKALTSLISDIDKTRETLSLSSAIRVYVLEAFRNDKMA